MKNTRDVCPHCGSKDVVYEDIEVQDDCLSIKVICNKCYHSWFEYYALEYDGYSDNDCIYDRFGEEEG